MSLLLPVFLPILCGILLLTVKRIKNRKIYVGLTGLVLTGSTLFLFLLFTLEETSIMFLFMTKQLYLYFAPDLLSRIFAGFASILLTGVSFYAFSYMKHDKEEKRFFGFYLLVYGAIVGLILSGNLFTMYLFFEMLTLCSFLLVLHKRTPEALHAGFKYVLYSIAGAFLALFGIFYFYYLKEDVVFQAGGIFLKEQFGEQETLFLMSSFLILVGFSAKAGMFPLHGWLPTAHPEAPTPASAILSGVITKSGIFVLIRMIFYVIGVEHLKGTFVQFVMLFFALLTILMGSIRAYQTIKLKKRLAYSTVSQLSYILFGIMTFHPLALMGALLHVIYHGFIKSTLFLTAGVYIEATGHSEIHKLRGIAKKFPFTTAAYLMASLALIGIPPASAFLSKWYLAQGALQSRFSVFAFLSPVILLLSALLTAAYLLPLCFEGYLKEPAIPICNSPKITEKDPLLLFPILIFAAASILLGMFPNSLLSLVRELSTSTI